MFLIPFELKLYITNKIPTKVLKALSSELVWFSKLLNISHLHVFGYRAYFLIQGHFKDAKTKNTPKIDTTIYFDENPNIPFSLVETLKEDDSILFLM